MDAHSRQIQENRRRLLAARPSERIVLILESRRPAALARALPAQDFYLTLVEASPPQARALLPLASRHQLDFLFDIDAWGRDRFSTRRLSGWLERFAEAGPEVTARWLREGDEATVVLALSRALTVFKLDPSVDESRWPPEPPPRTLDGLYFLAPTPRLSRRAFEGLLAGLAWLRSENPRVYEALLEQALWVIPAEQEEETYAERASRLAERGFPPFEESLEVWAPRITAEQLAQRLDDLPPLNGHGPRPTSPASPTTALLPPDDDTPPTLATALAATEPARAEAFIHDLSRLGGRFAVASLAHLGRPQTHREGLRLAFSHANLGLELLSRGDEPRALLAIEHLSAAEVAGAGTAAVMARVERARRQQRGWLSRLHLASERLDAPLARILDGLLRHRPRFEDREVQRPFQTVADLECCDDLLATIECLGAFLETRLGADSTDLPELASLPACRRTPEEVEWSAVALTAIARRALGGEGTPLPLTVGEVEQALALLLDGRHAASRCNAAFTAAAEQLGLSAAAAFLAARLEDSAQAARGQTPPDPARLRALLFAAPEGSTPR